MLTPINPPGGTFPNVSQAMRISGGDLLILGGHVGTDADGNLVSGGFAEQLDATFQNIRRTLEAAGAGFEAVARLTFYVTDYDPEMVAVLRKVRSRYINPDVPPASVLVSVAALYDPAVRVEVDGFAVLPAQS